MDKKQQKGLNDRKLKFVILQMGKLRPGEEKGVVPGRTLF